MMKKSNLSEYDYDFQNDSIFFYVEDKKYKSSIDLGGIILDFSEDNSIMDIEILDASEKFNVSKSDLDNIKHFDAIIEVNEENIKITMKMEISKRNKIIDRCLNALTINSMNLTSGIQGIAVSC